MAQEYNDVINKLQDYMLNNITIERSLEHKIDKQDNPNKQIFEYKNKNKDKDKEIPKMFIPNQKDTLFWCLYFLKHEEIPENINMVIEKKIKIEYIEEIRKNKQVIKLHKFATLTHLENQLANELKIDLKTFFSLCVIENLNVLYIYKKTFFEVLINTDKIHIIHCIDNSKYSCNYGYEGTDQSKIDLYKSTLFKVDNIEKSIKSISAYKVSELIDFCNKLGIDTFIQEKNKDKDNKDKSNKSKSKKELYESIIQYF
jgi:hypothetical protein